MTYDEAETGGLIRELARVIDERERASGVLAAIDFPSERAPTFANFSTPLDYWRRVCTELGNGAVPDGLRRLITAVARMFPGNTVFTRGVDTRPPVKPQVGADQVATRTMKVVLEGDTADDEMLLLVQELRRLAAARGVRMQLDLALRGSVILTFSGESSGTEQEVLRADMTQFFAARGAAAVVTATPHQHRDYFLDPLYVEGPDGSRYEIDQVRAATRVSELARSVVGNYDADFWPADKAGGRPAVVDHLDPATGGRRRLRGDQTLHDSGVRPRDTLVVNPEAVAGAVNPMLRAESLAQVRNQIQEFAAANPWFQVEVNSTEIPTEYVFSFPARAYASIDLTPVDHHRVFLQTPADFPLAAPVVFWQHEIFHPNIEPKYGLVCLGALAESYRSGLHFGVICQMLVDMAGYRNYVVSEGYNPEAARWAASPAGQAAIQARGGVTLAAMQQTATATGLRLRRLDEQP